MSHLSAAEVLASLVSKLGSERGTLVHHIHNDFFHLRVHWKYYRAFFGTNPERVELMNSISGDATLLIQNAMWHETILTLCRLTDPEKGGRGDSNITIRRLVGFCTGDSRDQLNQLTVECVSKTKFARDYRNKFLAHADDAERNKVARQISPGSRANVEDALEAIAECLRYFHATQLNATLITHPISPLGNDAVTMIEALHLGRQEQKARESQRLSAVRDGMFDVLDALQGELPDWVTYRPKDRSDG